MVSLSLKNSYFIICSTWRLTEKPKEGFYTDLLRYKHACHPNISATKFGEILLDIDPWLKGSISSPLSTGSEKTITLLSSF